MYINLVLKEDAEFINMFSLSNMKERINNGESLDKVYSDIKQFIIDNKDINPDAVQRAIAKLMDDSENYYDEGTDNWLGISGYTRKHQGDSAEEILGKVLNTEDGEQISGFVCSTIHEFGMRILDDCGVKAVMLAGGTGSSNHTCLLWQRSDGKYVQTNYGDSYTLDASNMKDAAREVYKHNLGLLNNGYIYFIDNDGSYQEFSMKDEAVWGNELDKRDYNGQSVFDHSIALNPFIKGNVSFSNMGSVEAEVTGTIAYGNETVSKETSYSVGYKKSNITSVADNSMSIGFKLEHKSEKLLDNGRTFSETKFVADYTKLHTDDLTAPLNYLQPVDHKEFGNPEQEEQLRNWFADDYERTYSLDNFQWHIQWCKDYLQDYNDNYEKVDSPISHDEFIEQTMKTYVDGNGVAFADLNPYGQENALITIEKMWKNYIINNRYNGAEELVQAELDYNIDHYENYDKYKNEYIDKNLSSYLYMGKPNEDVTREIKSLDTTNFTLFFRKVLGREKTLLSDNGIELTNGYKISGTVGFNDVLTKSVHHNYQEWVNEKLIKNENTIENEKVFTSFGGDIRLAAEEGLKLDIYNKTSLFSSVVSGGLTADMSLKSGTLTPTVSPGVKLNGSTIFQNRLSDNVTFGIGLKGYSVITKPSIDYGAGTQLNASYKPSSSDITIFGNANYGIEQQRIRIGGFNEQTENVRNLGVSVGAQIGDKGTVSLNYNGKFDKLNSTRDRSVISVGARVNL